MMQEVAELIHGYQMWLKDQTILRQVEGWVEVTTPFLDRDNDALMIYTYALLNDRERSVPDGVVEAFQSYGIKQIPWSKREQSVDLLAA
ncbi:MAG: DUF1829 domain-containing protein [Magnetococcales bacterium]|nr:DUF1829 domain-containing protein [Magnetococcales bacterium]